MSGLSLSSCGECRKCFDLDVLWFCCIQVCSHVCASKQQGLCDRLSVCMCVCAQVFVVSVWCVCVCVCVCVKNLNLIFSSCASPALPVLAENSVPRYS